MGAAGIVPPIFLFCSAIYFMLAASIPFKSLVTFSRSGVTITPIVDWKGRLNALGLCLICLFGCLITGLAFVASNEGAPFRPMVKAFIEIIRHNI